MKIQVESHDAVIPIAMIDKVIIDLAESNPRYSLSVFGDGTISLQNGWGQQLFAINIFNAFNRAVRDDHSEADR